jgi:two-component system phosphate regulon sensor histidine kinase PhoR
LLRLSRLDQGRVQFELTAVDLNELVTQYVADRQLLSNRRGLTLVAEVEPDLPLIEADRGLLGQVLSILLTNALAYASPMSVITVATQSYCWQGEHWVGFSVCDTGPGILPEEQPRLFERFFRGAVGRESGMPGTGLGLAIANQIVSQHNGRIEFISSGIPGEGTLFAVWLPGKPLGE